MSRIISINHLPRYSPWPARLLKLAPWQKRTKTAAELDREYEIEFFGPLLNKARNHYPNATYRQWFEGNTAGAAPAPCYMDEQIHMVPPSEQLDLYIDRIEKALSPFLPAAAFVDLGAGTGKIPFCLAERGILNETPVFALEYSASGLEFIRHFATNGGFRWTIGNCDFTKKQITSENVPKGAVLMTSMTVCCLPQCDHRFLQSLIELAPSVVVHVEPCYDLLAEDNLHQLLCRRYIEINDYNQKLYSSMLSLQAQGVIEIIEVRPHLFGANPLLPASILIWKPCRAN